jgi:MoaA/NifB/PqqE/SkfB family radical SAM enzyme
MGVVPFLEFFLKLLCDSKMHYTLDTFVRHSGSFSLLWNRRTSACMILESAKPFLDAVDYQERSLDEIVSLVAGAFQVSPEDVRGDVLEFCEMLVKESFCEGEDVGSWTPGMVASSSSTSSAATFDQAGTRREDSWTPLGSFFEERGLPIELHIDLTNGCTERCIHCYIPDYTPHFLPLELVKKILREFREAGGLTVHFSGGECMMHPDFAEILHFAKGLHLNMLVLSNLTLCVEEKIALLKEIDPQFVNVSLYSMDAATHDGITRLPGSWRRTMDAILALQATGVHIRLASPVMKNNQSGLADLKKFADEHHVHLIPDCDIFGQTDHDCSNQCCALSPEEYESVLCRHPWLSWECASEGACRPDHKVCDIGKARIDVNSEGNYYPCDGCHGIVLGNAREMTFSDVWYGEKLNALRALRNRDFGECASCVHRRWCKVCLTRNFNETGDMFRHTRERCIAAAIRHKFSGE